MNELVGRKVMKSELPEGPELSAAIRFPAMTLAASKICCNRCGTIHAQSSVQLNEDHYFCPGCIQLGRVDSKSSFYHIPETLPTVRPVLFDWTGQLTAGQQMVSDRLQVVVAEKRKGMIWAVTGAGKTEMLFETIHTSLSRGERVGLASPRVDVCLELYPRLKTVFPKEDIMLLHGDAEEPYSYTKFVVCTTHQLLRFYQAFDLLIVDEVDAFPYVNEPLLQHAAGQAVKSRAALIYLTATPTEQLLDEVNTGKLEMIVLPARYHRRKLPIPRLKSCFDWRKRIIQKKLPKELSRCVLSLMEKNDVLLFCPSIVILDKLYALLIKAMPDITIAKVHAKDEERTEKVIQMREKKFRLFLTTTILERGVTFDKVSVVVIGAEHAVFSESALVQIAGRVDRKNHYTGGEVWFLHNGRTQSINQAIKQIKRMNKLAEKGGFVDEVCVLPTEDN